MSVTIPPGGIEAIGLPAMAPSWSSSTVTLFTVVGALFVIVYVYSTSAPPSGSALWQSPPSPVVPPQVSVPSVGSFRPTSVHSGDGGPLVPVVLSGLEEQEISATNGLPRVIKQAVRDGTLFDGVRHCWMEFEDLDAVHAFVDVVRLKYQLLARPE